MPSLFKSIGAVVCLVFALCFAAPNALADTTTVFDITASPGGIGGTLTVDVTNGTVTAVDITATGLTDFTVVDLSQAFPGGWSIIARDVLDANNILLDFTTTNPSSLVGFNGGTITFGMAVQNNPSIPLAGPFFGTITPAAVATPEPSSLALMLSGVGLVFAVRKRFSGLHLAS